MEWRNRFPVATWVLRRSEGRVVRIIITTTLTAAFALWAGLYGYAWYGRAEAEQVLTALGCLEHGAPFSTAETTIERFGFKLGDYAACDEHVCTYTLRQEREWAGRAIGNRHALRYLGLRPYWYAATIKRVGNRVGETSFIIFIELEPDYWGAVSIEVMSTPAWNHEKELLANHGGMQSDHYHIGWSHLHVGAETGEVTKIMRSSTATEADKKWAYTADLRCLTAFGGCGHICRLTPQAWLIRTRFHGPGEDIRPVECATLVPH